MAFLMALTLIFGEVPEATIVHPMEPIHFWYMNRPVTACGEDVGLQSYTTDANIVTCRKCFLYTIK